ncbi:Cupredoxin [Fusarium solani]|uniref:Cupredoxin n=1 Tax=Fusarium solani TaxID=169388 RepID=A0A9P9K0T1_FUSSL|nr:Cupredoxin [Fusarium solani]KAH7239745.1 Cupredoxin [Fusarium solani]
MLIAFLIFALHTLGTQAALRRFNFTVHSAVGYPGKWLASLPAYLCPRKDRTYGFKREVYLINGQHPGPLIDVDEGDDIEVFVQNDLAVETTIHWHGNFTYRFSTASEYGFFWYHSHFRAYYNDAIRGPLLIRPAKSRRRPFETLARNDDQVQALLAAEQNATNILLNDWTHELSDVIFARYIKTGAFPSCVDSILANGRGRVQCLPESVLEAGPGLGIEPENMTTAPRPSATVSEMPHMSDMSSMDMMKQRDMHDMPMNSSMSSDTPGPSSTMSMDHSTPPTSTVMPDMPGMDSLSPRGCMPPMMFNPGFNMSSLPPENCTNTTSPVLVIPADQSRGWLSLNLVNSGAVSILRVSLDGHSMFVYAADGLYTKIQEVNVSIYKPQVLHMELGQRYSVMIKLDQPPGDYYLRFATFPSGDMQQVLEGRAIVSYEVNDSTATKEMENPPEPWMYINGSAKADAALLDPSALSPFENGTAPPSGASNKSLSFTVSQTDVVTWVIDRAPFMEPDIPLIYGENSSGWDANTTIHLPINSTIDIIMRISNKSMDTMGHPIHLHGHKFWLLGSGVGDFPYTDVTDAPKDLINFEDPPYRDTIGLPSQGWAALRFSSIDVGMAVVLVEGGDQLPALVGQYNKTEGEIGGPDSVGSRYSCSTTLICIVVVAMALWN